MTEAEITFSSHYDLRGFQGWPNYVAQKIDFACPGLAWAGVNEDETEDLDKGKKPSQTMGKV